jgi:hypothetical protein
VSQPAEVLCDARAEAAHYLGFDLLLVRAPLRDGSVLTAESRVVEHDTDSPEMAARHAAIKATLLKAQFGADAAWRSAIDQSRSRAEELAVAAGLAEPPRLDGTELRVVDLGVIPERWPKSGRARTDIEGARPW